MHAIVRRGCAVTAVAASDAQRAEVLRLATSPPPIVSLYRYQPIATPTWALIGCNTRDLLLCWTDDGTCLKTEPPPAALPLLLHRRACDEEEPCSAL